MQDIQDQIVKHFHAMESIQQTQQFAASMEHVLHLTHVNVHRTIWEILVIQQAVMDY